MEFQTFINTDKGIATVKVKNPLREYYEEYCNFYKKCGVYLDNSVFSEFIRLYGKQIDKMVGTAQCNKDAGDTFDVTFGAELAYERYLKVFESYRINLYDMMAEHFAKMANIASSRMNHCIERKYDRVNKIEELTSIG